MKALVVDDELTSRHFLKKLLSQYGEVEIAVDGKHAIEVFKNARETSEPYDLICLDVLMPEMSGQDVLKQIRVMEEEMGTGGHDAVKVLMTTSLSDSRNIMSAFRAQCEGYLVKPVDPVKLEESLNSLGFNRVPAV